MPAPLPDLSLAEWMVLGVVAEAPTHGWPVVLALRADGPLGRVWTVGRPLVYRALGTLTEFGLIEPCGEEPGARGPNRTIVRATRAGRAALKRWLATPVEHVRDVRSEFLVKLALRDRAGLPADELVAAQRGALAPLFAAVRAERTRATGFDAALARWRREQAKAVERFLAAF